MQKAAEMAENDTDVRDILDDIADEWDEGMKQRLV